MARTSVKKNMVKSVNYLNRDFDDFRSNLIEFAKQYFPNTYNDFNEASPGMMFIEMAAYVGDVLSYYIDSQFRESLLAYAEEKRNVYNIAQSFGYKPKVTSPSTAVLDVFQTVPALNEKPDFRYALNVKAGAIVRSPSIGTTFRTLEKDYTFDNKHSFKKGTQFIILNNPVLREKEFYKHPNKFIPSRWTPEMEKSNYAISFNQGPQRCPGKELAIYLVQNFIYNLIKIKNIGKSTTIISNKINTNNIPQVINPCDIKFSFIKITK